MQLFERHDEIVPTTFSSSVVVVESCVEMMKETDLLHLHQSALSLL